MDWNPQFSVTSIIALFLLTAGLSGGMLTLFIKPRERILQGILCSGAGLVLGSVFVNIIPEAAPSSSSAAFILVGLLLSLTLKMYNKRTDDESTSLWVISRAVFAGLSVSAILIGLNLIRQLSDPISRNELIIQLTVQKFAEAVILGTLLTLSGIRRNASIGIVTIYALLTPLGLFSGHLLQTRLTEFSLSIAVSLAAGALCYVLLVEIIPYILQEVKTRKLHFGLLLISAGIACLIA